MDLDRIPTGVPGLDSLMEGGIPRGFIVMLTGNPGTGKTTLASHFIYKGLTSSSLSSSDNDGIENGVYISFNESKTQFYINANRLGMNFENFERQKKFVFLDFVSLSSDAIEDALEEIFEAIRTVNAKRIVFDSFSALFTAFKEPLVARNTIHIFIGKLMRIHKITSLIIIEIPHGQKKIGIGIEESVVDGIIRLGLGKDNASPFHLRVLKMRGTKIDRDSHICNIINSKGMIVYLKQRIDMTYTISDERISSGIPGFDEIIDNDSSGSSSSNNDDVRRKGLVKGTITAVIGATGSAKSTFAFQFIAEGVRKYGEIGIFCSLEDTADEIRRMGKGYGYNMAELEENGLSILISNPYEENPDLFIANLEAKIIKAKAKRLVIEGLSAFEYRYEKYIYIITKRLSSLVHKYQISRMITINTRQKNDFLDVSNLDTLFQNIIVLKFADTDGDSGFMKRIMAILKITAAPYNISKWEFKISSDKGGIEIVGPIGKRYLA